MSRVRVIGYRPGVYEGVKRENYKAPEDAGMILRPNFENKEYFLKLFKEEKNKKSCKIK